MRGTSPGPDVEFEAQFHRQGYRHVAGLDEVGRGCLAGPVTAGAVILPLNPHPSLTDVVRNSKQLSARQREDAYEVIVESALAHSTGWTSPAEIDRIGIVPSTRLAMRRALSRLSPSADSLLIDALSLHSINLPQKSIIRGDSKSLSIAAASIVAKVERDTLMGRISEDYPDFGFESHKGYGTQRHLDAIRQFGPCAEHRMSFRPLNQAPQMGPALGTTQVGRAAESFAAEALEDRGMTVITRNFRTRFGEVDLVAMSGETLVFVEVRARRSRAFVTPAETVIGEKSRRLIVACQQFLQDTEVPWSDWRIDVASVELDQWERPASVEFIESAIEE
ncbi:MAG: ribonuclease HII [Dehalococcoidia bacterium]|nr:ribonuclease HII [Dehalococcoidia bacterium]